MSIPRGGLVQSKTRHSILCESLEPRVPLDAAAFPDPPAPLGDAPAGVTVQGVVWHDRNQDGQQDPGEPGLPDWRVYEDRNGNGQFDADPPVTVEIMGTMPHVSGARTVQSQIVVGSGDGRIVDLDVRLNLTYMAYVNVHLTSPAGTRVHVADPSHSTFSASTMWLDDEAAFSPPAASPIRPNEALSAFDGEPASGTWTLEVVGVDSYSSLQWTGWALALTLGEPSAVTGDDGMYDLRDVTPDGAPVGLAMQDGWTLTEPADAVVTVDAGAGETVGVDFGVFAEPGDLSGTLWNDYDGDGVRDAGEPALAGWTVFLDANRNDRFDDGETFTLSGPDGGYLFEALPAGEYVVGFVVPEGWTQTAPAERLYVLYQTSWWWYPGSGSNQAQLAQAFPDRVLRPLPAPVGSVGYPGATSAQPAPQGLAVGSSSLFYIDGTVDQQVLWELQLGPESGPALTDPLVIDSDALPLDEPAGGLAYLDGLVYITLPASDCIAVFDPVADTIVRTMQLDIDIADGLTGAGDLGVLFAATPGGRASVTASRRRILVIDPQSGEVLRDLQGAPDKHVAGGWGVRTLSSLACYGGDILGNDPGWSYWFMDPTTGGAVMPSTGVLTWLGNFPNALGGDGAPRFARVQVRQDLQPVVDFAARQVTDSPATVDLLPGSDTGLSSEDNVTALNNASPEDTLEFRVEGTIPGATVELYARGVRIGLAVAEGTSTVVTTDGSTPIFLASGQDLPADVARDVWARQALPDQAPSVWSEPLTIEVDRYAPVVVSVKVGDGAAQRSVVRSLEVVFHESVVFGAEPFELVNETTGQPIESSAIATSYGPGAAQSWGWGPAYILTLTFPGLPGGRLPDGRYTLRLRSAQITDPIGRPLSSSTDPAVGGVDYVYSFHVLAGDLDGNAAVDLADLANLASHWNQPGTIAQGDASGDGQVDLCDLAILASNWNATLPEPVAAAARATRPAGRAAARPAAMVVNPTPAPRVAARRTDGLIDERPVDLLAPVVPRVR